MVAWREIINEDIEKSELDELERHLDQLFQDVGIDVEFTKHFHDRVNDERNAKPITIDELANIYNDLFKRHKPKLKTAPDGIEKLIKSLNSHINIPVVFRYDRNSNMIDMIAKTVMRKRNFKSATLPLTVK